MLLLRTAPSAPTRLRPGRVTIAGPTRTAGPASRRVPSGRPAAGRVLHVSHMAAPHVGGLETVVAAETSGLADRGWEVSLLSSACGSRSGRTREDDVRVTRVAAWNGLESRGVPFPVFRPLALLRATLAEVRGADVVHVHDPLYVSSWVAALVCLLLRTPYVVHRHVAVVHHPSPVVRLVQALVLGTMGRLVVQGATRVVAIDAPIAAWSRQQAPRAAAAQVLPNGVDHRRFRPAEGAEREELRWSLGLPLDLPLVLFVGRFVPKKGFDHVVAAAGDDYRVVMVGGDRPEGCDDERVLFLGALPPERVAEVYRCVDLFVVASVGECPLTVLEARASGLPVVVNHDPALLASPWTGGPGVWTCDVAEPGALRTRLRELLADRDGLVAAGAAAAQHVGAGFGWGRHLDRLETVYRELVPVTAR